MEGNMMNGCLNQLFLPRISPASGTRDVAAGIGEVCEVTLTCDVAEHSGEGHKYNPADSLSSRRIVLLGKSGVGKSAAGNTILGQREFKSVMRMNSVTSESSVKHATVSGRSVSVVDTPGFFDTELNSEELVTEIAMSVYISSPGPHAFIIVLRVDDRFTDQELQIPQKIEMMFGEEVLKYSIILFTHGDRLEGESVEKLIQENCRLRDLVDQCGGRFHVFNNRDVNNRDQVNDLLQKIDTMIEKNGGGHYSNQMYEDAQRFRREEEDKKIEREEKPEEIGKVRNETEEKKIEERQGTAGGIRDPQEPSSGFLQFLSQYKHYIYMAAVAAGFVIGVAAGGAAFYGVVGGAVGGGVAGAVVRGAESGTATGAVVGAVGGVVGGTVAAAAVVGGAAVYGVVGGAVGGGLAGAVVRGAESGTATGAVGGAAFGTVAAAAVVGGATVEAVVGLAALLYWNTQRDRKAHVN